MLISQSLIKEILKPDHCPKQVYYSFVEGKELIDPSDNMLLGRYFESELLGSCRGGQKQEARYLKGGDKAKPYLDVDELVIFAKKVFKNLGLDISKGKSQIDLKTDTISGAIDHINKDIKNIERNALYDVKWSATKIDDRWNGWGNPEEKQDAEIQAAHYILVAYEKYNKWLPFYFLVFGKDFWVKIIKFEFTEAAMNRHKELISNTGATILDYAQNNYKGNGDFNKCTACPFNEICEDKSELINIETVVK